MTTGIAYRNNEDRVRAVWWLDIEGLRVMYGSGVPSWSPADSGTNRPIIEAFASMPRISAQTIEPLDGSTTPPAATVTIVDVDDRITAILASATRLSARTVLTGDIGAADTNIPVGDSSVFSLPCDVYVDAETMRATAAPNGTTITVTRGMYGSRAVEHKVTTDQGYTRAVYITDRPPFILGRRAWLRESRTDAPEDNQLYQVAYSGRIESVSDVDGAWEIKIGGCLSMLGKVLGLGAPESTLKYPLWGGSWDDVTNAPYWDFDDMTPGGRYWHWRDRDAAARWRKACSTWYVYPNSAEGFPDSPGSIVVGSELIRYLGLKENGTFAGDVLVIDDAQEGIPNETVDVYYRLDTHRGRGIMSEQIFSSGRHSWLFRTLPKLMVAHQVGEQVKLVVCDEDFTAGADPISVLLSILQSSGTGSNGDYDVLPEWYGCGIHEDDIDVFGMLAIRDKYIGTDPIKFAITDNVEAKEWLEKNILRPYLLNLYEAPNGKLSLARVCSLHEAEYGNSIEIGEDDLLEIPALEYGAPPIGEIAWEVNKDPGGSRRYGKINVIFDGAREKYGRLARRIGPLPLDTCYIPEITDAGSATVFGGQNNYITPLLTDYISTVWDRFADTPVPKLEIKLSYAWAATLRIGDVLKVTCGGVPNLLTGSRGLAESYFQIIELAPSPAESALKVVALQLGMNERQHRLIAPSAVVVSYNAGNKTVMLTQGVYEDSGILPVPGHFAAGDKVTFYTSSYDEMFYDTIASIGLNTVVLSSGAIAPVAGWIMEISDYPTQVAGQKAKYASFADADGMLGGTDEGHVRS